MMKLCKFCGSKPLRNKPIYYNGLTYITNWYYVLRFDGRLEDAADATSENLYLASFMESLFPSDTERAEMRHAPVVVEHGEVTKCKNCMGYGIAKKCPHCDGEGVLVFTKDIHDYECECKNCQGRGIIWADLADGGKKCLLCEGWGDGIWTWQDLLPKRIGTARLCPAKMHILSRLPLIAWAADGINGHFIFFGGEGVLLGQKHRRRRTDARAD